MAKSTLLQRLTKKDTYVFGEMWRSDFPYTDMVRKAMAITMKTPKATLIKLYKSLEDVNYHQANAHLLTAIGLSGSKAHEKHKRIAINMFKHTLNK
jgi:hypothetical protein